MELVHFAKLTAKPNSKPDFAGLTPLGQRVVVGVTEGSLVGDRIAAAQRGDSAADWLTIGPDGTAIPDVRMALKTEDGAFLYMEYRGRGDASAGIDGSTMYTAITFETADPRYTWLNSSLFVGKGSIDIAAGIVAYDVYQVR
ncbi:hypothetical protein HD600_000855 [Microbacterium ginsengiterrae]|uniref:Uncharacterized protein n=1 Tax=Microbacterium ginsengiterrae TaxID=546115 RepID=A0A7W9CB46_9MICO|nr:MULTISPECIES: DUF3237 domain-containing protein [Microbacterium]MBB5742358.1 hypothetical protein [Microbacterium ginsengiterrae]